jgi:ribonuclease HII
VIVGVDEAGRGPLAGPVVAAAVLLCPDGIAGLNDSKKLTEKRRIALEAEIKARCRWAIGVVGVEDIDRLNIFAATMRAMTLAVEALLSEDRHPELVSGSMVDPLGKRVGCGGQGPWMLKQVQHDEVEILIDGNMTPHGRDPGWRWPARAIVGGDATEPCISAASIIAKQARDTMMVAACGAHPGYGFAQHKGYGTAAHMAALKRLGPCAIHRRSFAPVRQALLL